MRGSALVLTPGNIGAKAARAMFTLRDEQLIEVGNAWGFVLDLLPAYPFEALLLLGHPGKLAKLAQGQWDTHSAQSGPATDVVAPLHEEVLGRPPVRATVEGIFAALDADERARLADTLAERVRQAVGRRPLEQVHLAVVLVDMAGQCLGSAGDLTPWR